jgi:hypothetical protein
MRSARLLAFVTGTLLLAGNGPAGAQLGPVERGVICLLDGTIAHLGEGPMVDENYNYLDLFRDDPPIDDPLDGGARPSVVTAIETTVSDCLWLGGQELDACFPENEALRYHIDGLTVTDTACLSRTFKGTFRLVDENGEDVIGENGPACTGDFFCGHAKSEIAIDVVRVVPGISDPGSVDAEPNNGRGETPPLIEQCTLELNTTRDGSGLASSRFGLASLHLLDDGTGSLPGVLLACSDPDAAPASTPFAGVVGSSSLGF